MEIKVEEFVVSFYRLETGIRKEKHYEIRAYNEEGQLAPLTLKFEGAQCLDLIGKLNSAFHDPIEN